VALCGASLNHPRLFLIGESSLDDTDDGVGVEAAVFDEDGAGFAATGYPFNAGEANSVEGSRRPAGYRLAEFHR
jgi:hypothetical protein